VKYFDGGDLFELFEFTEDRCDTMDLLRQRDGFKVNSTPTIERHLEFLQGL
jgi:hypothetical protein